MSGRTAIVTGAFGAFGRVLARTLASQGHRLALVDAAPAAPAEIATGFAGELLLAGVDLTQPQAARAAVATVRERLGEIDTLVNVAGGFTWQTIEAGDLETWQRMYATNVAAALNACQAVLPGMLGAGRGCIVNVGAAAAARAAAGMGAYTAAKSAVTRLTEALAEEVKDRGVRVNAVLPSIIDTPANRAAMPDADPGRWVPPEALADVVAFLVSDGARAIHGAGIEVRGRC